MTDDGKVVEFPTSKGKGPGSKKTKNSGPKRKLSHPNLNRPYNPETGDRICELISEGLSYKQVQDIEPNAPSFGTMIKWRAESKEFDKQYMIARRVQAENFIDQLTEIADNSKDAAMAALRIKTRQWIAAKRLPQVYGDAVRLEMEPETSLNMTALEAARRIAFAMKAGNIPIIGENIKEIEGEVSENTGSIKLGHSNPPENEEYDPNEPDG